MTDTIFTIGAHVTFRTSGKPGLSDFRTGRVVAVRETAKGKYIEIAEDGAKAGVFACARPALVLNEPAA